MKLFGLFNNHLNFNVYKTSFKVNRAVIIFKDILLLDLYILKQLIHLVKCHILKHICNMSSSQNIFDYLILMNF